MLIFRNIFPCLFITKIIVIAISPNATITTSSSSTTTPPSACPTTFDNDVPEQVIAELCRSGASTHTTYYNPYNTSFFPTHVDPPNPSLASYCSSAWDLEPIHYFATAPIMTTTEDGIESVVYDESWDYVASKQCCLNCTLFGENVQVYFWPTPAPSPLVSTLINANNYTL